MQPIYLLYLFTDCGNRLVGVHSSPEQAEIAKKDLAREVPQNTKLVICHCMLDDYSFDGLLDIE